MRVALLFVTAVVAVGEFVLLPPRAVDLPPAANSLPAPTRGVVHIHTRTSDGTGTVEEVAAAAASAGLTFVIVTDHGNAARQPAPPRYIDGVLCLEGVEISTEGGHVLVLGLARAPYPLGGEARDVVEDVERLGGFAVAAHPASVKPELRWNELSLAIAGLEWLNGDSEWRDEDGWSLARVLFTYPWRPREAIATLLDRPEELLRQWDALTAQRRVVAIAGADAHARVGFRSLGEPYDDGLSLRVPSYEQVFRTFSIALTDVRFSGDAVADAAVVLEALRQGQVYSVIDALAGPAVFSFTGTRGDTVVRMGAALPVADPLTFRASSNAPPGARITLLRDGVAASSVSADTLEFAAPGGSAVYRVEVDLPGAPGRPPVPWILSNPIYVGRSTAAPVPAGTRSRPTKSALQYDNGPIAEWRVETSPRSLGAIDRLPAVDGAQIGFRYALGGTPSESPFAAMVMPAGPDIANYDRLVFAGRASRPMRVSVQLRTQAGETVGRWHRSVYLDERPRDVSVFFDDMTARDVTTQAHPVLGDVQSVLFVVDSVNAETGSKGDFIVDDVRYAR
jgi:hypothetical protein